MWPLCDFTAENGGTVIVPGSHRWTNEFPGPDSPRITIEMPAGSLLLYRGSLWHGGGANHTDQPRLGVVVHYAASWLRPVENHVLVVPPERRARLLDRASRSCSATTSTRRSSATSTAATRASCSKLTGARLYGPENPPTYASTRLLR
jgi:ectoine hydroxylase-related dioxygenase (phytanoyl-CoA dioxygenase family)